MSYKQSAPPSPARTTYKVYVFNEGAKKAASHDASEGFVKALWEEVKAGKGFIPFLGAGFSVTAGIPIIRQLLNYLQRCICLSLGAEPGSEAVWNPRCDQWPPFVDRGRTMPSEHWIRLMLERMLLEMEDKEKGKPNTRVPLYQEALGAMAEWRSAQYFLSRLVLTKEPGGNWNRVRPELGVPDQDVVDACWREVMRGKAPTLNHRMLAHISGLLRIDLILTTNFDGLVEKAFEETRDPMEVFDVHMGDRLPALNAVGRQRSIVKLHGSKRSLRADYSLDAPPNPEDVETLFDYIAGRRLWKDDSPQLAVNNLLLAGVGGTELRTFEFVRQALDKFGPSLKIFWIAYNEDEIANIRKFFANRSQNEDEPDDQDENAQIQLVRHTDAGLLFLHLYQYFRKSLPSSGGLFPSITRLAFPPLQWGGHDKDKDDAPIEDLARQIRTWLEEQVKGWERILVVPAKRDVYGVCTAAGRIYRELEPTHNCLWIDMNDVYDADNLFEAVQEAAFYRLGEADWTPLYVQKDETTLNLVPLSKEIQRILQSSNRPWVLFLDAREIPGSNHVTSARPNGWMDDVRPVGDAKSTNHREAMRELLVAFAKANPELDPTSNKPPDRRTLQVVLLCNDEGQASSEGLTGCLKSKEAEDAFFPYIARVMTLDVMPKAKEPLEVVREVLEWTDEKDREDRRRFLQTLVLMQRPRYMAVAWSKSAHPDWNLANKTDAERMKWLDSLGKMGLLRRMHGGFIWLQAKYREALRKALRLEGEELKRGEIGAPGDLTMTLSGTTIGILEAWGPTKEQAEIHLSLTTWYRKVFDATLVAPAILEAVEHLCESSWCLVHFGTTEAGVHDPAQTAADRMAAARELLREHQFLIQSQGHPRATLRRLLYFQNFWVKKEKENNENANDLSDALRLEVLKFQSTVAEVCRVVLREIGEDAEAYAQLRDVAVCMTKETILLHEEIRRMSDLWLTESRANGRKLHQIVSQKLLQGTGQSRRKTDVRVRELVRWWRWCGMMALWSRSHDSASRALAHALYVALNETPPNAPSLEGFASRKHPVTSWKNDRSAGHKFSLEAMHTLEISAYCLLLRAHTLARRLALKSLEMSPQEEFDLHGESRTLDGRTVRGLQAQAEIFAQTGLRLVEQLQNNGQPSEDHDLDVEWCKSRLLMIAGLAAECGADPKAGRHAMSMISDAAACLNRASSERTHSDLAIVEMRRAEVRLQEAATESITLEMDGRQDRQGRSRGFEAWTYDRLRGDSINSFVSLDLPSDMAEPLRSPLETTKALIDARESDGPLVNSLGLIKARALDAHRYLDRAEPILRKRRRNVWWTTWYFERRLRAISLLVWVAVLEGAEVLPYIGLEAAAEKSETEPDRLLEDARRMVRVDSYRLAMVALSYASCVRALQIYLELCHQNEAALTSRLVSMRNNLNLTQMHLEAVIRLRNFAGQREEDGTDGVARDVIEESRCRIANVLAGLAYLPPVDLIDGVSSGTIYQPSS